MGHRVYISAYGFLACSLMLLVLPLNWFMSAAVSAIFHELCHICAVWLCGGRILSARITSTGAEIGISDMGRGREALCAAAGPVGSLSLLLLANKLPEVALCSAVQGVYNLLPFYPLDGGRILRCILPEPVRVGIERLVGFLLILCALLLSFCFRSAIVSVFAAGFICMRVLERKRP